MQRIVPVYEDPLTRKKLEGAARLVRPIGKPVAVQQQHHTCVLQRYVVNFPEDGPDTVVERLVNLADISGGQGGGAA